MRRGTRNNMFFIILCFLCYLVAVNAVMIKRKCPEDEVHKSCAFHEEYYCWHDQQRGKRVRSSPKRLVHCRSGCYCKKGFVRAHAEGRCIPAPSCRNYELREVLKKLPSGFDSD